MAIVFKTEPRFWIAGNESLDCFKSEFECDRIRKSERILLKSRGRH